MPFLGFKSNPVPWCVVSCDRPKEDVEDSLESMELSIRDINLVSAFGRDSKSTPKVLEEIQKSGFKFAFWEGLDLIVKNPNNQFEVKEFLSTLSAYCYDYDITILGTVGVAKLKPHEIYPNPRQLVAGASVWERATSTDFIIVPTNPGDIEDGHRLMYVCLKKEASFAVQGEFDDRKLNFDPHDQRISGDALKRLQAKMQGRKLPKEYQDTSGFFPNQQ